MKDHQRTKYGINIKSGRRGDSEGQDYNKWSLKHDWIKSIEFITQQGTSN